MPRYSIAALMLLTAIAAAGSLLVRTYTDYSRLSGSVVYCLPDECELYETGNVQIFKSPKRWFPMWGASLATHASLRSPDDPGEALRMLQDVRSLHFYDTRVDEACIAELRRFPQLEVVKFIRSEVDDHLLIELRHCPRLRMLRVVPYDESGSGLHRLHAMRPDLRIRTVMW
jgi:hypothetical protein